MVRYKMVARDPDASPTQYRTWITDDEPDLTGAFYTGPKSGDNPFTKISAYAIFDPNIVVDFNLPNPTDWSPSKRVLPEYICDSQLGFVDGYVYLFGSQNSNKIFRSTIENPTEWIDTGATLPDPLSGSQLAVVDGYFYLFGGMTGSHFSSATNNIYSAPLSDPLSWTNHGALLPNKLHHSQLIILDNFIYLFGGNEIDEASNVILRASISDPLTWIDTGKTLPDKLHSSHVAIMDGYILLLGGLLENEVGTSNIYSAEIGDPTSWIKSANLPYPAFSGQLAIIGDDAYLFTPTDSSTSYTKILRCKAENPFAWVYTKSSIPGYVAQSQLGIIYDRLYLFGGNGNTAIFMDNYFVKYDIDSSAAIDYGYRSRTQINNALTKEDIFKVLGFPYWKTSYIS